jgi:DNA recombination-dependent growth factor C
MGGRAAAKRLHRGAHARESSRFLRLSLLLELVPRAFSARNAALIVTTRTRANYGTVMAAAAGIARPVLILVADVVCDAGRLYVTQHISCRIVMQHELAHMRAFNAPYPMAGGAIADPMIEEMHSNYMTV